MTVTGKGPARTALDHRTPETAKQATETARAKPRAVLGHLRPHPAVDHGRKFLGVVGVDEARRHAVLGDAGVAVRATDAGALLAVRRFEGAAAVGTGAVDRQGSTVVSWV